MQHMQKIKRAWRIAEVICLLIVVLLAVIIIYRWAAMRRVAKEEASAVMFAQDIDESTVRDDGENLVIRAEFASLLEQNQDTVGLLRFEGDRTLYVCQTDNNEYYMDHRFDGSEDSAGMIYMDYRCSIQPRSDNYILYGHNMADGSRFGTLKRFRKVDYLLENPVFTFMDLYQSLDYIPFGIFTTSVLENDPAYFDFAKVDFESEADFEEYVANVRMRSVYDLPDRAEYGDQLLTLVTCSSDHERGRLVIVCYAKK